MKSMYLVTIKVTDRDALLDIIDRVSGTVEIMTVGNDEPTTPQVRQAPRAPRKLRGSKVNQTILSAMGNGPASISAMKKALEDAGLAAGSLSTGIATLTKAGEVERVGEGLYGLKGHRAAAE